MHADAAHIDPRFAAPFGRGIRAGRWFAQRDDNDAAPRGPGRRGGPGRGGPHFGERFGGPGFGGPPMGGPGFGRRGRSKRGDIRAAVLALLAEEPMHGYQIITELESRSQGAWRPSPGSVYPMLQALEDEGLLRTVERDGRKVAELTTEGRTAADAVLAAGTTPWEAAAADVGDAPFKLFELVRQIANASKEVVRSGTPRQVAEATKALSETRKRLYQILAEDEPDPSTPA